MFAFAGCADVMMAVISPIQNMRVSVNNTMPYPVNQIGTSGTRVSIINPQPYYAKILNGVQRDSVCVIPPGGSAFDDQWSMNFSPKALSLVAVLYRDSSCREWVGMSMAPIYVYTGQSSSWTIDRVWYPDNAYRYQNTYGVTPYPLTRIGGDQKVVLMGPPRVGMNYIAIPNCTYYTLVIRIDGKIVAYVPPEKCFRWADARMYTGTTVKVQLTFIDQYGLTYGYKDLGDVSISSYGSNVYQYMATSQDIQRY